ncbi:MAG: MotA/TolQ/ExbB proton channel family protein [Nostoc sp. DcaGUA01]|nr:MotA/TolQ/ExbB proton channel family protein [Nostoc sp. DcaGUA01]
MEIVKVWDIIWDSEPFHWATVFVLVAATFIEFYSLWRYWYSECGETKAGIKFLSNFKKDKNVKLSDKVSSWLEKHLATDELNRIRQQTQKNGKFVLIKYPSVLASPIPRSSLRFVTTLCTAIGVLGTFYGIQEGLQGINLSTQNSQELMNASTELLAGMKTAFSTSLMGLGSGSIFTLILFWFDSLRQKRRESLRYKLNAIATLKTTDNSNGDLVEAFIRVGNKLSGLNQPSAEAIGQAVGKSIAEQNVNREVVEALSLVAKNLTGLKQLNAEGIGQAVGRSIAEQFAGLNQLSAYAIGQAVGEQVQTAILPALRAIFKEQQQLRELQENQGQRVLEELIKDMRVQVLEPIADRLDKSAELTQQASTAVLTLHRELGGISQSLASSILTIQNFQKETLVELKVFANHLGYTLNQFQTDTKGVLEQTAQEINRAVDQSIQGMTAQRTAFETSAVQAAATFKGIREELQTALQERAVIEQNMLQGFANNMGQTLSQFQTETTGVIQQTAHEINRGVVQSIEGMTAQRSAFEASAVQAAATFRGIREELQTALQERAVVEQEMLQATRTGIIQILTQANRTFHEQTNTLKTVGNQASGLMNDAKDNLLATLGNIDAKLTATRQTVEDDLTRFRQEYQANLQMFFEEQNNLLEGTLGKQQDGLSGVVNNLDKVFQEESERRSKLTQEVDKSMTKIQTSVEQINQLVCAAGLNDAQRLMQLEKLASGIGQQVQRVDNSYINLNQKFDLSLQSWQSHLEVSMQRSVDSQLSFFQEADTSMSRVCGHLLQTAEVLRAALDNIDNRQLSSNARNYHG